jgi:hypothetical protein
MDVLQSGRGGNRAIVQAGPRSGPNALGVVPTDSHNPQEVVRCYERVGATFFPQNGQACGLCRRSLLTLLRLASEVRRLSRFFDDRHRGFVKVVVSDANHAQRLVP